MEKPPESIRELARLLYAAEAAAQQGSDNVGPDSVCERLRVTLTRFSGAESFSTLLRRSIALSRADFPALEYVTVVLGGRVEGLDLISRDDGTEAGTEITANLLWLLVTLMGEPIAMRLVKHAWPDLSFSE